MFIQGTFVLLTALLGASVDALYTKKSPVLQVDATNYDRLIARSNYVSIVEFYAPWCGHCQNLKPAYEKAARKLEGLAKVAAMNCEDEANKHFCGLMRVQGFPTLRLVVPSDQPGKPKTEDYQGPRTAKGIVDTVVSRIPNHVKRLTDKDVDGWLADSNTTAKAILFTDKGATSALLRTLSIDFLGKIHIGQVRNKETSAVQTFGITKFPTLVLLPGADKPSVVYDGEMKKKPILEFLSQAAEPNPDPPIPVKKVKPSKPQKPKKPTAADSPSEPTDSDSASNKEESSSPKPSASTKPQAPVLRMLSLSTELKATCLTPKTGTCVLAIVPIPKDATTPPPPGAVEGLNALREIEHKHSQRKGHLFPFYLVPDTIEEVPDVRKELGLNPDIVEVIAVNGKRGWWRRYNSAGGSKFGIVELEKWIDQIRMGEGEKETIPEQLYQLGKKKASKEKPDKSQQKEPEQKQEQESEAVSEPEPVQESTESTVLLEENTKTAVHEEL
ncbi:hypothetical protein LOZ61_004344 [Ophidiomyces ophidiicola]|uniref:Uncharacterized protein n=1 Tax=Ophidiomyces ophidiicola TaxID=1387563 RepID=A0ACB8V2W5_9EURO|nr:hypothetical protein LOZ61_004344 [Ophidiomyces ophidiicola]KAI1916325.1 hypothetical protein LOZ64_003364 [Ophidiomyces ophidiicola]KAI1930680.1 hypothetical protein LOZ60_000656 [Ophidiomyces ophidiicola]KAI1955425.1 hypothetical protein LOZ59_004563 [Ophidiomyces ophidiicola]KAI1976201.1 hypothetical protein LOZ56_000240 [Ophidiomyces ophidiicola]